MFRRFGALLAGAAILFSMAACAAPKKSESSTPASAAASSLPKNKTITVSWFVPWWMQESDFQYIFDDFARKYPGYTIKKTTIPSLTTLLSAIQAGNQPDVWMGGDPNTTNYISACYEGLFQKLDNYLNTDPTLNFKTIDKSQMDLGKFYGHYYALPYQTAQYCMIYNKTLFSQAGLDPNKPPMTWTEFYNDAKKLTKFDSNGVVTQLGVINGPYQWQFDVLKKGGDISSNGIDCQINTPWELSVIEYCNKFNSLVGSSNTMPKDVTFDMTKGNVAIDISGNLTNLNDVAASGVDYAIAKYPRPDDYNEQLVPSLLWYYLAIPQGAKNPDGGWLFAKYAMTDGLYDTISRQYQKNPSNLLPQYIACSTTRQKVYDTFLPNVSQKTAALIKTRDALMTDNTYSLPYSAIHATYKQITSKWDGKYDKGQVNLQEKLQDIDNEYNAQLAVWEKDKEAKGWQFPKGKDPIPPASYN